MVRHDSLQMSFDGDLIPFEMFERISDKAELNGFRKSLSWFDQDSDSLKFISFQINSPDFIFISNPIDNFKIRAHSTAFYPIRALFAGNHVARVTF